MDMERELRIEPYGGAVRAARGFVADALHDWRLGTRARDITLACHELVANAVLHAATPVLVRLRRDPDGVLVEVADSDPHPPCPRLADDPLSTSGRGLLIVERLSRRWGVRALPVGKVVWAELPGDDPVSASPFRLRHPG
ncbi:ATP-binding protein [Actinocatenispora rupis]|uniref:ATP-binding protein n=1 Tax=Actinocatenispora rupis TaxID=519421 RepID=A0A8J3J960_9ACTN|nr:ATP-binding protein [Actinocatenispora rupis]GID10608.1 ATP-binding protein [Actinocatenispora rupis]